MHIEIIKTLDTFNDAKEGWRNLLNNCEDIQIFYSWEWTNSFITNLLTIDEKIFIIMLKEGKKIIAIAPFKIRDKKIFFTTKKYLTNLTDVTTDYNSIMIDKSYNYKKILEKIADILQKNSHEWDIMRLINLNEKFYLPQNLYEAMTNKKFSNLSIYANTVCPYFKYSDIKSNKKQLADISRRRRNIEKEHNIEIYLNKKFDLDIFNKLVEFKNDKYSKGVLSDKDIVKFYKELAKQIPENINFSYMKIDNKIVAIHFGFRDKNKYYYYMPSFDPAFRNKGVGMILLQSIIEYEKDNIHIFDFLKGNEPYKFIWTDKMTYNYDIWAISKNKNNFFTKIFLNIFILAKTVPFFRFLSKKIQGK